MTPLALLAPFAATFVLLASMIAVAIALLGKVDAFARRGRALASSWHAAVIFAPAILAGLSCIALGVPDAFSACHCDVHGLHHPHLCISHPMLATALVVPSACILGAWALLVTPRLATLVRELSASAWRLRAARRMATQQTDDVVFRLVDGASRSAVTVGAFRPIILVDRRLWDGLASEERRAVLHHEHAHVERRDGLTLLVLRLCMALYPVPLGPSFLARWRSSVERMCDRHAATVVGDADTVAAALLAVEEARRSDAVADMAMADAAMGIASPGELESRVVALLALDAPTRADAAALGNDTLAVGLVALGAGALTLVWPGGLFHHAVETLLGVLVP